jgi:hypothetical protein
MVWLKYSEIYFSQFQRVESKIKVLADLVSGEGSFLIDGVLP